MRELDLLMTNFLDRQYLDATADQQRAFRELVETPDPVLLAWLTGRERPADPVVAELVDEIRNGV